MLVSVCGRQMLFWIQEVLYIDSVIISKLLCVLYMVLRVEEVAYLKYAIIDKLLCLREFVRDCVLDARSVRYGIHYSS